MILLRNMQANDYEIVVNCFHISHDLTWYSAIAHKFTRIYPVCSTYELTNVNGVKNCTIDLKKNSLYNKLTHAHFIIDFVGSKRQQLCGESPCSQEWSSPRHLALSTKPRTRPCFGPLHSRGGRRGRRHWHEGRIWGRRRRGGGSNIGYGRGGRGGADGSAASANSLGRG